jgi:hypothetical protein
MAAKTTSRSVFGLEAETLIYYGRVTYNEEEVCASAEQPKSSKKYIVEQFCSAV